MAAEPISAKKEAITQLIHEALLQQDARTYLGMGMDIRLYSIEVTEKLLELLEREQ